MTQIIQTWDCTCICILYWDIRNPRELYNETCADIEIQIYPEQNLHNFSLIPKVYFAITVHRHNLSHTHNPLAVLVQTLSSTISSPCHRQVKRMWYHTILTDKHMGCRQFDTFNMKKTTNDKLLIFSILSSHCWRSYSSITMEKKIQNNIKNNAKLSLGSEMRKPMQYWHTWSFLKNFHDPKQRRLQPPSLASEQSTCTHTHLETGTAFHPNHELQQTAGGTCSPCPLVYLLCSSTLQPHWERVCGVCPAQVGHGWAKGTVEENITTPCC